MNDSGVAGRALVPAQAHRFGHKRDHSEPRARDARKFCRQHGLDRQDTDLVAFLVKHHLTMSKVAQKQDLADEAVIRGLAGVV